MIIKLVTILFFTVFSVSSFAGGEIICNFKTFIVDNGVKVVDKEDSIDDVFASASYFEIYDFGNDIAAYITHSPEVTTDYQMAIIEGGLYDNYKSEKSAISKNGSVKVEFSDKKNNKVYLVECFTAQYTDSLE